MLVLPAGSTTTSPHIHTSPPLNTTTVIAVALRPSCASRWGPPCAPRWGPSCAPQWGPSCAPRWGPPCAPRWGPSCAP
eukprot:357370-Chlamydomonas_euryale.AAC.3